MKSPKIVVIGAGSASFGLSVLGALLQEHGLRGSRLCLVDINADGLEQVTRLARRLNTDWDAGFTVTSSTDRREVLDGADFVVLSIAIDREACWRQDIAIAQRHGIMHYAENGGPGAFAHAARNIAVVMDIFRDIEAQCPDAWLLNFTNPVPRICTAAARFSKVKTVGVCHQIGFGYMMVGNILRTDLGIDAPPGYRFVWEAEDRDEVLHRIVDAASDRVDILAAGINHFTWMLAIRDRRTGDDLYPLLWERLRAHDPGFEPLTRDAAETFGLFPVPGDCHMCEYLPYTHNMNRGVWERYDIQMYNLGKAEDDRNATWGHIEAMASGKAPVDALREVHSERAEKLIAAMAGGNPAYEQAVNLPNAGYITNLPEGAIVEVPGTVSGAGVHGVGVGALPEPIAELCRRQIAVCELAVEAAVRGDRSLALQALALDPMVDDLDVARQLLDDYLDAFRDYLPQFHRPSLSEAPR